MKAEQKEGKKERGDKNQDTVQITTTLYTFHSVCVFVCGHRQIAVRGVSPPSQGTETPNGRRGREIISTQTKPLFPGKAPQRNEQHRMRTLCPFFRSVPWHRTNVSYFGRAFLATSRAVVLAQPPTTNITVRSLRIRMIASRAGQKVYGVLRVPAVQVEIDPYIRR